MKKFKFWLDDVRVPPDSSWVWAHTVDALIHLCQMADLENVSVISLDHDLGELEKTGYDFMNWLEEQVLDFNKPFPTILIHSANSVGRNNMQRVVDSIERKLHREGRCVP